MDIVLNPVEARVLGCLMEKETTTPDYYPLSLNALVNACNQKSNRDPWMEVDEEAARLALRNLSEKGLAGAARAEGRVIKYEHRMQEAMNLTRRQAAIVCELLLRGAQTPGELRGRAERMTRFDDLSDVQATLQQLMQREPALVAVLPRAQGMKEARYAGLLTAPVEAVAEGGEAGGPRRSVMERVLVSGDSERMARLEAEVEALRGEISELRAEVLRFQGK